MKYHSILIVPMLAFFLVLSACKEEKSESNISQVKEAIETTKTVDRSLYQIKSYAQQLKEHEERLKVLTPMDKQPLIDWFPEKVEGMPRVKIDEKRNGFDQSTVIKGFYSNNASGDNLKMFNVEVMDGAGPEASGVVAGQIAQRQIKINQQTGSGYQKIVTHGKIEAHEYYNSQYNSTKLNFSYADRFGILVSSHNLDAEELWSYVDQLGLEQLKNL